MSTEHQSEPKSIASQQPKVDENNAQFSQQVEAAAGENILARKLRHKPALLKGQDVLRLQRIIGNQAVLRLLRTSNPISTDEASENTAFPLQVSDTGDVPQAAQQPVIHEPLATLAAERASHLAQLKAYAHPSPKSSAGGWVPSPDPPKAQTQEPLSIILQRTYAVTPLIQRIALVPGAFWLVNKGKNQGQYNLAPAGGKAHTMVATGLKLAKGAGPIPNKHPSPPVVFPPSWPWLHKNKLTAGKKKKGPPFYVRMHLLNDRLGGSGALVHNLAPGTVSLNNRMSKQVENRVINRINMGYTIVNYTVKLTYNAASPNLITIAGKAAWMDTVKTVKASWTFVKMAAKVKKDKKSITDKPHRDKKPNWVGH